MEMRRIALISSSYHPYTGGVEQHTRYVARELADRGHEVQVWTVDRGEHLGSEEVDGVLVRYLPCPQPAMSASAIGRFALAAPSAIRDWLRTFRLLRPDVLHVQCFGPNGLYALGLHRTTGAPLLVSSHGETFADDHGLFDTSRIMAWALRRGLAEASAVTGCSQFVLDDLELRFGAPPGTVVPNGVLLPDGAVEPDADPGPTSEPIVAAVGRMEMMKGFDLLLEAFTKAKLPAGARLIIGGDGPTRAMLRQRADELGAADRVEFPGRLDPAGVAALMRRARVVVVPSRREAFGITVLEAWRSGRPVIATTRGGPPEFITEGVDGFLVDPEDTASLALGLQRLVGNPELAARVGSAGRRRVKDFSWARVVDRYEELYHRCRPRS